jgi:hypothetical protein
VRRRVARPGKGSRILAVSTVVSLAVLVPAAAGAAAGPDQDDAISDAVHWLGENQLDDGGFDGFVPGSGTPDALLALAESAQTESEWSKRPAVERVEAQRSSERRTPLDAAQALARRSEDPAIAARLATLVAQPLGLDTGEDGPFGDLDGRIADGLTDADLPLRDRVDLAVAQLSLGLELPEGVLDGILAEQQSTGGWHAEGDDEAVDLDTTGAVVDLLVLAGVDPEEGPIATAMGFIAGNQAEDGAWAGPDGEPSAIATAGAIRAIRSVGHDPAGVCWRTDLGLDGGSTSAEAALVGLQGEDGAFAGEEPVVATASAVHALSGRWLPRGRASDACGSEGGGLPFEPSLLVLGAIAVVGVGGGVRILRSGATSY